MTTTARLSLEGVEDYLQRVARLADDFEAAAAEALMVGAEMLQDQMIERVPVDTGNLMAHIKIKGPQKNGTFLYVDVGVIPDLAYTDADTARYALVMEYGSASVKRQSYIRPSIAWIKPRWNEIVATELQRITGVPFA
jgi:HK97 gp10 family phage protein